MANYAGGGAGNCGCGASWWRRRSTRLSGRRYWRALRRRKALQGRILHTQIVQMTDNVSSDVWHQPNYLDPPFVRLGFAAVELTIMPWP